MSLREFPPDFSVLRKGDIRAPSPVLWWSNCWKQWATQFTGIRAKWKGRGAYHRIIKNFRMVTAQLQTTCGALVSAEVLKTVQVASLWSQPQLKACMHIGPLLPNHLAIVVKMIILALLLSLAFIKEWLRKWTLECLPEFAFLLCHLN